MERASEANWVRIGHVTGSVVGMQLVLMLLRKLGRQEGKISSDGDRTSLGKCRFLVLNLPLSSS